MGVPSIVSDAGALPETVQEGVTGWIAEAGSVESLQRSLGHAKAAWDAGALGQMGIRARSLMCQEFDQRACSIRVADELEGC